jgi:LysR family hca operon transcriptional activator
MELRHLRYFVAVAEEGNLTAAAQHRLFTSQPSLSRQIRDLETEVGAQLLLRSAQGVTLTPAGRTFLDHARLALAQVDAGVAGARKAARPAKSHFAIGFLTGMEMTWLPEIMRTLHAELPEVEITVSSSYSPDLAEAVARGRLDVALIRAEPHHNLTYQLLLEEALIVLMPSDHPLAARPEVNPKDLEGQPFIAASNKAAELRAVIDAYLQKARVHLPPTHGVDNLAMAMSMVASTRGISLMPAYAKNLLPWSVTSRPLAGAAPKIGLYAGYLASNKSPILKRFLQRAPALADKIALLA